MMMATRVNGPVETTEIVMTGLGGPEVLTSQRRTLPAPRRGQVLVRTEAAGVSFAEVQQLRGRYPGQPAFPFVPGYDLVGTVLAAGPGTTFRPGQRVAAVTRFGAWAAHAVLPTAGLVEVPDALPAADAVALVLNGVTAWQMLHRAARAERLPAGAPVLVHGASGGVGTLLTQLARHRGLTVLGTASRAKHDAVRALGAVPLDYRDPDLAGQVRRHAPDGVAAVFDHVGGDGLVDSWRLLGRGGTLVWYGSLSSRDATGSAYAPMLPVLRRLVTWNLAPNGRRFRAYYIRNRTAAFRTDLARVFGLAVEGVLTPVVADRYPLASAAEALGALDSGQVTGKVVLVA